MDFDLMLRYCTLLEQNNDRSWFHAPENYRLYTEAKQAFTELVEALKMRIAGCCSPDLAERLIFADAKGLLYRIPRDMRVNKGKPPYNPRWSAYLAADRHSMTPVGYYVHIQPGDRSLFGTGAWCESSETVLGIRSYISENARRFLRALKHCGYPMSGDRLKNVPRGFDPADPAAEYLKFKDWLVARPFPDAALGNVDAFLDAVAETVEQMEPLRQFFSDAFADAQARSFAHKGLDG